MYRQNGDLANLLKLARKKVPQSVRLSAGGAGGCKSYKGNAQIGSVCFIMGLPWNGLIFGATVFHFAYKSPFCGFMIWPKGPAGRKPDIWPLVGDSSSRHILSITSEVLFRRNLDFKLLCSGVYYQLAPTWLLRKCTALPVIKLQQITFTTRNYFEVYLCLTPIQLLYRFSIFSWS